MTHCRNTNAMRCALRCGAKTRKGTACQAPAVAGKARCRMHGGARGSGAPRGNQNAFKNGLYTAEAREMRQHIRLLTQRSKEIIDDI